MMAEADGELKKDAVASAVMEGLEGDQLLPGGRPGRTLRRGQGRANTCHSNARVGRGTVAWYLYELSMAR